MANVQNIPLFREKNESRFSGSVGAGEESESYEIQAAHSVSDRIGIMGNYMHARGGEVSTLRLAWKNIKFQLQVECVVPGILFIIIISAFNYFSLSYLPPFFSFYICMRRMNEYCFVSNKPKKKFEIE